MTNMYDLSEYDLSQLENLQKEFQQSDSSDDIVIPISTTPVDIKKMDTIDVASRGFQPPIKGDWKVSGIFSLSPLSPRHSTGHLGVDMRASAGTPIYPMMPGVVTDIGSSSVGGLTVNIDHKNGIKTYYAHCSTIKVQKGDIVGYDTQIATVGDTGNAKGTFPHLHFQVSKNGQIQNPNQFFNIPSYTDLGQEEKFWLSEQAKEEAKKFDLKKHKESNLSFSKKVEEIAKMANSYYRLAKTI